MAVSRTILQVNGTYIPDPASLQWGLMSVSDQNAGRTTDGKMHVNLIARKRKLELSWTGIDFETTSEILQAVNEETFDVTYHDALTNSRITKTFYVGDRTGMVYSYTDGYKRYSNVNFNIIEI